MKWIWKPFSEWKKHFSSLRFKMSAAMVAITLLFVSMALVFLFFQSRASRLARLSLPLDKVSLEMARMRQADMRFLLVDIYDLNYYKDGYSEAFEMVRQHHSNSLAIIGQIAQAPILATDEAASLREKIDLLEDQMWAYAQSFESLARAVRERGLLSHGIEGELNDYAAELASLAEQTGEPQVVEMVANLRSAAHQYLLRRSKENQSEISRLCETYREEILLAQELPDWSADTAALDFGLDPPEQAIEEPAQAPFEGIAQELDPIGQAPLPGAGSSAAIGSIDSDLRMKLATGFSGFSEISQRLFNKDKAIGLQATEGYRGQVAEGFLISQQLMAECSQEVADLLEQRVRDARLGMFIALLVAILVALAILYSILRAVRHPLGRVHEFVRQLATGAMPQKFKLQSDDEITDMLKSLNTFVDSLRQKSEFASAIGRGELDVELRTLGQFDDLGASLQEMKDSLNKAQRDQLARREEDRRRNWNTEGVAKFSTLLREYNDDVERLSHNVLKNLVKYLDAHQGGMFILQDAEEREPQLDMVATFAYDQRKFLRRQVDLGEGLAGICALERKTIHLTEIPPDYLYLESGLGQAAPRAILVVPLQHNGQLYGVVELAALANFEPYQVQFVEQIAQTIAATLATVKVNIRTARLLEESKKQSEELASQEEEMRQNMEELQATQEESARKERELSVFQSLINENLFTIDYTPSGEVIKVSEHVERVLKVPREQFVGKHFRDFIDIDEEDLEEIDLMWSKLRKGEPMQRLFKKFYNERFYWFEEIFTPVKDEFGQIRHVLCIGYDVTKFIKMRS